MIDIEQLAGRALGPVACTKRQKLVTSSFFFAWTVCHFGCTRQILSVSWDKYIVRWLYTQCRLLVFVATRDMQSLFCLLFLHRGHCQTGRLYSFSRAIQRGNRRYQCLIYILVSSSWGGESWSKWWLGD